MPAIAAPQGSARDAITNFTRTAEAKRVGHALDRVHAQAREHRDRQVQQKQFASLKEQLIATNPELSAATIVFTIGALLTGVMLWPAIVSIDFVLLAAVTHLLLQLAYSFPGGPPWWAVGAIPASLVTIELVASSFRAHAMRDMREGDPSAKARVRGWLVISVVLALVVPTLGSAAVLKAMANGQMPIKGPGGALFVGGIMALAATVHSIVVFGGAGSLNAIGETVVSAPAAAGNAADYPATPPAAEQERPRQTREEPVAAESTGAPHVDENQYLRSILRAKQRDADGEVHA